jgi:hypothetical protein
MDWAHDLTKLVKKFLGKNGSLVSFYDTKCVTCLNCKRFIFLNTWRSVAMVKSIIRDKTYVVEYNVRNFGV